MTLFPSITNFVFNSGKIYDLRWELPCTSDTSMLRTDCPLESTVVSKTTVNLQLVAVRSSKVRLYSVKND